MAGFKSGITGADKVLRALERLPNATRKKAIRPAMRKGAKPIQQQVIANIQSDLTDISTHTLEKNIVIRAGKTSVPGWVRVVVAIAAKKLNPKNAQRLGLYGSVREFGKEGQPAKPAFRPAAAQKANESIIAIINGAKLGLDQAVQEAKR